MHATRTASTSPANLNIVCQNGREVLMDNLQVDRFHTYFVSQSTDYLLDLMHNTHGEDFGVDRWSPAFVCRILPQPLTLPGRELSDHPEPCDGCRPGGGTRNLYALRDYEHLPRREVCGLCLRLPCGLHQARQLQG